MFQVTALFKQRLWFIKHSTPSYLRHLGISCFGYKDFSYVVLYPVRVDWLLRCLDSGSLVPWEPQDMIHATAATLKVFNEKYDRFGDQYDKVNCGLFECIVLEV